MSKKLIFLLASLLLFLFVAALARYIDPDRWWRHREPRLPVRQIAEGGGASFMVVANDGAYTLPAWLLRTSSTIDTSLHVNTEERPDGTLVLRNGADSAFILGKSVATSVDSAVIYNVLIEPGDRAELQISRSILPYYAGWKVLSSAPLFRHFRYYHLRIQRANGATLEMEWKFNTYRLPDGQWSPDQYGSHGEGLVRADLRAQK